MMKRTRDDGAVSAETPARLRIAIAGGGVCGAPICRVRPVECCGDNAHALLEIHVDVEDIASKCVGATIETGRMLLCGALMWVPGLVLCVVVAVFVCIPREFRCVL